MADLLYQNREHSLRLWHYSDTKCLVLEFDGDISHEDYVEGSEALLHQLHSHNYHRYIFDNTKLRFVSVQSRAWFIRKFFSRLHVPKQRIAVVSSEVSASSRVAVDTIREAVINMGFEVSSLITTSLEEALKWMEEEY